MNTGQKLYDKAKTLIPEEQCCCQKDLKCFCRIIGLLISQAKGCHVGP